MVRARGKATDWEKVMTEVGDPGPVLWKGRMAESRRQRSEVKVPVDVMSGTT